MSKRKRLIVIGGPTASGKTSMAIAIAQYLDTEIVSADSRQFYAQLNIGTAKPSAQELAQVKHHLVGHLDITTDYSMGQFEAEALLIIERTFKTKDWAVLVGGSGSYLKAVVEGLDVFPKVDKAVRDGLQKEYEENGLGLLLEELKEKDKEYFEIVDKANPARIIRALSVIRSEGKTFSSFRKGEKKQRGFECIFMAPYWSREKLYERINQRTIQMLDQGLLHEVKGLKKHSALNSLNTVGYKEIMAHLDGAYDLRRATELIQQNTRRYAKRQMTWMRGSFPWIWVQEGNASEAISYLALIKEEIDLELKKEDGRSVFRWKRKQEKIELKWINQERINVGILSGDHFFHPSIKEQVFSLLKGLSEGKRYLLGASQGIANQIGIESDHTQPPPHGLAVPPNLQWTKQQ